MPLRSVRLVLLLAVALAALTACAPSAPIAAPSPEATAPVVASPSASPTPTPTPTPTAAPLPPDALLVVTATATLSTGQALDLRAVVLKAHVWSDPIGKPRADATVKRCLGEVDYASVIKPHKWAFGEVDYTATLAPGSAAWPANNTVMVAPYGTNNGSETRTAHGDVYQKEYVLKGPGNYEPYCVQRAFLKGPGTGALYLGSSDSTGPNAFKAWSKELFGFTYNLPKKAADPTRITVSDCVGTLTPLGMSLGAPNPKWATTSSGAKCLVGDPETQNTPHT